VFAPGNSFLTDYIIDRNYLWPTQVGLRVIKYRHEHFHCLYKALAKTYIIHKTIKTTIVCKAHDLTMDTSQYILRHDDPTS